MASLLTTREELNAASSTPIAEIIRRREITTWFQPIVSARQRMVVGVEALSRHRAQTGAGSPEWLFEQAASASLTTDLERLCCETAIEAFAPLVRRTPDLVLFLNTGSWLTTDDRDAVGVLERAVHAAGLAPDKIALEILETHIRDGQQLVGLIARLRGAGFLLALDDVGVGHSNLDRIPIIKPDVLKVDRSLISEVDVDFHKQETLKSLVGLSRKIGALVVAEGVETERESIAALELGADLLQGYYLSRPSEDGALCGSGDAPAASVVDMLAQHFKRYMVDKINRRKLQHRRFNIVLNEVLCHLAGATIDGFESVLMTMIPDYPKVECMYVLNNAGVQVTDTICHPTVQRRQGGVLFHPAAPGTDHSLKEYYYILLDVELQKYTTEPYVSFATGNICQTISTYFRDATNDSLFVLCIDVVADERPAADGR